MVEQELKQILDFLDLNLEGKGFDLGKDKNLFLKIVDDNKILLEQFESTIREKWDEFLALNENRVIKKSYTTFFYQNFHQLYERFTNTFFSLDSNRLKPVLKEKISERNLLLEYHYTITPEEYIEFQILSEKHLDDPSGSIYLTGFFYFLTSIFGMIFRRILKRKFFILLDGAVLKRNEKGRYLHFMIVVKDSKDEIFQNYFYMIMFYFLKQVKGVPEEKFERLLEGREKLYEIALQEYPKMKDKLVDLLYYFYKKCKLLQSFSPLLDFLNFVGSRVEDSKFSKVEIIKKDFLNNFDYSLEKKNSLLRIFDFLDKSSSLYSTFQANNLPSAKAQFNLFLLYMKYYFGSGLEALEVGDLLFKPNFFKEALNRHNTENNREIDSNSIKRIGKFIDYFSILVNIDDIDIFFKEVLNITISDLNYVFFRTFLHSLNIKFLDIIENENNIISEDPNNKPFTFNIVIDHICRILYTLIDRIFLRNEPSDASENFIDPRGRYIGKNIALRVLELLIFEDINFSDDIWPEYLISINRDKVKKDFEGISIPDKFFYTTEDVIKFIIYYNLQSLKQEDLFEHFLLNDIIVPLNKFILEIKSSVKDHKNQIEVYEKLMEKIADHVDSGEKETIKEFKFVCQQLAMFWTTLE